MSDNYIKKIKGQSKTAVMLLGAVLAVVQPLFPIEMTFTESILYTVLVIASVGWVEFYLTYRQLNNSKQEISKLKGRLDQQREYNDLVDSKYTLPVRIQKKGLYVDINEDGDDQVKFENEICAEENTAIDKFYGFIGTDKSIRWEDLNVEAEGATVDTHHRRDYEEFTRFIITLDLDKLVKSDGSYEISYSITHDVVDVEEDHSYLNIRHPVEQSEFRMVFPEGWKPKRYIASPEDNSERNDIPQPDRTQNDDGLYSLTWSYSSASLGDRYEIDWKATQTD